MGKKDVGSRVAAAMRRGQRVQQEVRAITLNALAGARPDRATLGKVMREIVAAIHEAAAVQGESARQAMHQAEAGVETALAQAGRGLRLSLRDLQDLSARLSEVGRARWEAGLRAGAASAAMFARAAAGMLAGMADKGEMRAARGSRAGGKRRRR